ncbi:ABC transporter substrate-binding protein [Nocardioides sp.]|uniref:ABC transporter substrate-binding protein n=1 Tax=Nocardioides sp. TaxID=35761 RepID=UPI0037835377
MLGAARLLGGCSTDGASDSVAVSGTVGERLGSILGIEPGEASGKGLKISAGASIILSGALAPLGQDHLRGLELGLAHVRAAGGPNIQLMTRDNGMDTAKGVANVREFAASGCPVQFTDYAASLGAEVPAYKDNKIFAVDPGGSIAAYAGSDFYYMTRPTPPQSYIGAQVAFMRDRFPDGTKWALIGADAGTDYNTEEVRVSRAAAEAAGYSWAGDTHVPYDTTNFSAAFSKLGQGDPDVIQVDLYGGQLGIFLKQYATSGLSAKLIGIDFTPEAQKAAGSIKEYYFANDWFDPVNPTSDWAALLVEEYRRLHKTDPLYPAAEYYQAAFIVWDVIRQVIADGNDPTKGGTDNYVRAVSSIDGHQSVFGGRGKKLGTFKFDANHLPAALPCTICSVSGQDFPVPQARFNVSESTLQEV